MKSKNRLLTIMILAASAAAATAVLNKCIKITATSKNLLTQSKSLCFKWRFGTIHYTKEGTGKPLLLIHDLTFASSGYEWSRILPLLKDHYTVYTIDLLGCGLSEKPDLTYTNFLYVQLLSDFVKSEIGHRTDIICSGASSAFAIMACNQNPELFNQLMLINPESIMASSLMPGKYSKIYKIILDLPILGTLLYHIASSKQEITEVFKQKYFYNPYSVKSAYIDTYYESAHLGNSPKSLYASTKCNYTKCNIVNALKKIDNSIYFVGGKAIENIEERAKEYQYYNSAIETSFIENTKLLPHLEHPQEVFKIIQMFFV